MITDIATLIKTKHKEKELIQKELAESICARAVISEMEKNETTPPADLFFKLVKRLGIDMPVISEILELANAIRHNRAYSDKAKQLLCMRDYENLVYVSKTLDNISMTTEELLCYDWLLVIADYMTKRVNLPETVQKLGKLSPQVKNHYFQLYLKAVSAITSIYSENHEDEPALQYFESIIDGYQVSDGLRDRVALLYSIFRAYFVKDGMANSLAYIPGAIDEVLKKRSICLLGDFLLVKAYVLDKTKFYEEAEKYCRNTITISELEDKELLKNTAQKLLIDIEEKIQSPEIFVSGGFVYLRNLANS